MVDRWSDRRDRGRQAGEDGGETRYAVDPLEILRPPPSSLCLFRKLPLDSSETVPLAPRLSPSLSLSLTSPDSTHQTTPPSSPCSPSVNRSPLPLPSAFAPSPRRSECRTSLRFIETMSPFPDSCTRLTSLTLILHCVQLGRNALGTRPRRIQEAREGRGGEIRPRCCQSLTCAITRLYGSLTPPPFFSFFPDSCLRPSRRSFPHVLVPSRNLPRPRSTHPQEAEKLKALRKSIDASKAHLAELEQQHKTLEESLPKGSKN